MTIDRGAFTEYSAKLANGLLREAIGYHIEAPIPYYRGIVGFVVNAPMLWIRHSRFPLLFVAYDRTRPEILEDVVEQLAQAGTNEFFALLVVVPSRQGTGNEAEELRRIVADSVYSHDFVVLDRHHVASIVANNSSSRLIDIMLEQGIDRASISPYNPQGPIAENMFFGRESEIKSIRQSIDLGNYAIVGGRRIGKSSILQQITRILGEDTRYQAIYHDCEYQFNHEDFFAAIYAKLGGATDRPELLGFHELVLRRKDSIAPARLVFLLDEIDELLAYDSSAQPAGQLFKLFRALAAENQARFVFSGSRTLFEHLHDSRSPFFNFCDSMELKLLGRASVAELVRKPMDQLRITIVDADRVTDAIVNGTSCHPSLVQWLCDRLVRSARDLQITDQSVAAAAADREYQRRMVETAWSIANNFEKLITLIVTGPTFTMEDVARELSVHDILSPQSIRAALRTLEMAAVLERSGDTYSFALATFPEAVRAVEDVPSLVDTLRVSATE